MKSGPFTYTVSDSDKTGIYMISVYDERTGFVVRTAIPDHGKQSASLMAFAGARFSRSKDSTEDIFAEIKAAGSNAQEKLANIFKNYGHASVADMANLFLYIENIPKHYEARFFNESSIGGGQARSSRYQDFGTGTPNELDYYFPKAAADSDYHDINQQFKQIQQTGINMFAKWKTVLTDRYTELYEVDINDKKQVGALTARVFDSARVFLVSGLSTRSSLAWITNAREWARLIGVFKGSEDSNLVRLAEQIEALLAPQQDIREGLGYIPEAPDLIKYTQADETSKQVHSRLREFLDRYRFEEAVGVDIQSEQVGHSLGLIVDPTILPLPKALDSRMISEYSSASFKVIAQHIILLYPSVGFEQCQAFLYSLSDEAVDELGAIIFSGYDHHTQMSTIYRVNQLSYDLTISNAEAIDFNRHRAWGRFSPLWLPNSHKSYVQGCLENGYVLPLYIDDVPELIDLKPKFIADMDSLYALIISFLDTVNAREWFGQWILPQILPLGHNARLIMHGSIKEVSYMTKLRVRPGGHINYRDIAWQIAFQTAYSDPMLASLEIVDRPNPASREEFLDRS